MTPLVPRRLPGRLIAWGIAAGVLAVFAAANAHLVAVARSSQPPCVPHLLHSSEGAGALGAATSSC